MTACHAVGSVTGQVDGERTHNTYAQVHFIFFQHHYFSHSCNCQRSVIHHGTLLAQSVNSDDTGAAGNESIARLVRNKRVEKQKKVTKT